MIVRICPLLNQKNNQNRIQRSRGRLHRIGQFPIELDFLSQSLICRFGLFLVVIADFSLRRLFFL